MKDKSQREINYARISLTERCNLNCSYCHPMSVDYKDNISKEDVLFLVEQLSNLGIKKVRLTGGEPLLRSDIIDIIKSIYQIEGIDEVVLTTNGILLKKYAKALFDVNVKRINIGVDTLSDDTFEKITGQRTLDKVLQGIDEAIKIGFNPIKINCVLMNGINDHEIGNFISYGKEKNIEVRFIEQMPFSDSEEFSKSTYLSYDNIVKRVDEIDSNNQAISKSYEVDGYRLGIINSISKPSCNDCSRIRITTDLNIKPCLLNDIEVSLEDSIKNRDVAKTKEILTKTIFNKPEKHAITIDNYKSVNRNMHKIGG